MAMSLTINYPEFIIRRDSFPMSKEGEELFDEMKRFQESVSNFHRETVALLTDRFTLPTYATAAAANAQFTAAQGDIVYNTTDNEPMFYNGTAWKKVTDGTTAT